jgi:hypothetical protein
MYDWFTAGCVLCRPAMLSFLSTRVVELSAGLHPHCLALFIFLQISSTPDTALLQNRLLHPLLKD